MQQSRRMHSVQSRAIQAASNMKKKRVKGEEIQCKQIVPFHFCGDLSTQSNQTKLFLYMSSFWQSHQGFHRLHLIKWLCSFGETACSWVCMQESENSGFKWNNNVVIKEMFHFYWYNLFISSLGSGATARSSLENAISRWKMGLYSDLLIATWKMEFSLILKYNAVSTRVL